MLCVCFHSLCVCVPYVWAKGRIQHVGLQTFEVDVSEDGVLLDLHGATPLAAQTLLGVLRQQLKQR